MTAGEFIEVVTDRYSAPELPFGSFTILGRLVRVRTVRGEDNSDIE
jgi:hypothetical protein